MLSSGLSRGTIIVSSSSQNFDIEITTDGRSYETTQQLKEALRDLAIKCNFEFHFIKNVNKGLLSNVMPLTISSVPMP